MKWELKKDRMNSDPTTTCYRILQDGNAVDTIYNCRDDDVAIGRFNQFIIDYNIKPDPIIIATVVTGEGTNP